VAKAKKDRVPLSRDRVLEAAMAIADAGGLEALTMRGLARDLGVEPMSLYHYAASRDSIVAAIVDRVVEEIELPGQDGDWKSAVRASAMSAHEVLKLHPWACNPLMSAPRVSAPRLRMIDGLLARLGDAGLQPGLLDLTYHAIDSHILGFTLWFAGYTSGPPLAGDDLRELLERINIGAYPHLAAHAAYHLQPRPTGGPSEFAFGLDLILDGAERMRDEATAGGHGAIAGG
jgi:AcrR family transcriptional regulator